MLGILIALELLWGATDAKPVAPPSKTDAKSKPLAPETKPKQPDDDNLPPELWGTRIERLKPARTERESKQIEAKKLYLVGLMHLNRNRFAQALRTWKLALDSDPEAIPVLRAAAPLAYQLERKKESLEFCERGAKLAPDQYEFVRLLGILKEEAGDRGSAVTALEKAVQLLEKETKKDRRYLDACQNLARLYQQTQNATGMARVLGKIVDMLENPDQYELDEITRRQVDRRKVQLYNELGAALKITKQFDEAIRILERGRTRHERGDYLSYLLAEIHLEKGDAARALTELERFLKLQLPNVRAYELLERCYEKLGKSDQLLKRLEDLVNVDKYNQVLRRYLGLKLAEAGRLGAAEEQLRQVSNAPEALPMLAKIYWKLNKPKMVLETLIKLHRQNRRGGSEMEEVFEEVVKDNRRDAAFVGQIAKELASLRDVNEEAMSGNYVVARLAEEVDDFALAETHYKRCLLLEPDDLLTHYHRVLMLMRAEKYEESLAATEEAIRRTNRPELFQRYKALNLEYAGKTADALKVVEQMAKRGIGSDNENLADAKLLAAQIHIHAKDYPRAEEVLLQVVQNFPDLKQRYYAHYLLSNVYTLKGELPRAEKQLMEIIKVDASKMQKWVWTGAQNDLGYLWADEGKNLEKAHEMIKTALDENPDSAAYLDSMGWVLFKRGDFQEARKYLERATGLKEGNDPVIWDHLGDTYLQLGDSDRAKTAWRKAIEAHKKDKERRPDIKTKVEQVEKKLKLLESRATTEEKKAP